MFFFNSDIKIIHRSFPCNFKIPFSLFLSNFLRCTPRWGRGVISSITAREFRCTQLSLSSPCRDPPLFPKARLQPSLFVCTCSTPSGVHENNSSGYFKYFQRGGIERIFKYGKENTRGGENDGEMRVKGRREEKARESKGWNYYYYYLFVHTVIKHEDLNVKWNLPRDAVTKFIFHARQHLVREESRRLINYTCGPPTIPTISAVEKSVTFSWYLG